MGERLKVMLVDDDATVLEVTAAVLEQHGYDVQTRDSAIGTSLAILRDKPDVVLLDVHMPGLSGDKLAELMGARAGRPAPLVILHSASTKQELEQVGQSCGAADVIEKSASPLDFLRRFESVLSRHAAALPKRQTSRLRRT
jgi:DNA-binding response OmpR family regulator